MGSPLESVISGISALKTPMNKSLRALSKSGIGLDKPEKSPPGKVILLGSNCC
jgi:hypothetical protein